MHPHGPVKNFFWSMRNNKCWVLSSEVICLISTPTTISGHMYNVSDLNLKNIGSWLQKKKQKNKHLKLCCCNFIYTFFVI